VSDREMWEVVGALPSPAARLLAIEYGRAVNHAGPGEPGSAASGWGYLAGANRCAFVAEAFRLGIDPEPVLATVRRYYGVEGDPR
jgi:hypothetical protein